MNAMREGVVEMGETEQLRSDLRATKENVLEYGWLHKGLGSDDGPRCVVGAINCVTMGTVSMRRMPDVMEQRRRYNCGVALRRAQSSDDQKRRELYQWNDANGRTVDEVIALIDAALASLPTAAPECSAVPAIT